MEQEKPCVMIYRSSNADLRQLRSICSGIEEEMIPFEIEEKPDEGMHRMSFAASERSRLGVGIALVAEGAALSYEKLSADRPLFVLKGSQATDEELQKIGINAARLVKGIAFKE